MVNEKNKCEYLGYYHSKSNDGFPKKMPTSATYILGVEWSWSPVHSRADSYYISTNRSKSHWFFWHSYVDDNDFNCPTINTIVAICEHKNINIKDAAIRLLECYWKNEANERELDKNFWYTSYGLLSDKEAQPIADKVLKKE